MPLIDELSTPCLLIDEARLEANLSQMQARADRTGVALRPHTKTHKMVRLAKRQVDQGAQGVTVAKVGEAEVYAEAGIDDICIAYTVVGQEKLERIAALGPGVSFCVDSIEGARQASAVFADGSPASVLIEIDAGYGRCGIRWDDAELVPFARDVAQMPGLQLVGILTHEGDAYQPDRAHEVMVETRGRMLAVAARLRQAGVVGQGAAFAISMGSTPSAHCFENETADEEHITEIRPGNYVFHDMTQVNLGVCNLHACALTVLTTVIAHRRDQGGTERFFLDAGRKVFTSDRAPLWDDYGRLLYHARNMVPHPHARLVGLSEEHGWGAVAGGSTFAVGDRVRVVPNHACVVVNTQDEAHLVRGDEVVGTWTVDARGRVR